MKKFFKPLAFIFIIAFIWTFIMYLFFSFGTWDFNPGHWSINTRTTCSILGGSMGIMLGIALYANRNDL
jgi:hypothetical protein